MNARRATGLLALALVLAAPTALAQTASDSQAARDTEFDGLRLLDLAASGLRFGYVEKDTRPSEGVYV
ncbi:MAG: hypothetical protein ACRETF_08580, partial [Nevskiaceae bacterium]